MKHTLRRIIITSILIIVSFIIQSFISVYSGNTYVTPNIMIILTCLFGFMSGKMDGLFVGFFCGLLADIFACDIIGLNALIYMYIGYLSGLFNRLFYEDQVMLTLGIVFGGDFLYNFSYYISRFLLRNKLDFSYYMMKLILPEMVFTTVVALAIFKILYKINSKWLVKEQRSTLSFD